MLNEKAREAVDALSEPDAAYCRKLALRLAAMGVSEEKASRAVCSLVEADAIPEAGVTKWAGAPRAREAGAETALDELSYA